MDNSLDLYLWKFPHRSAGLLVDFVVRLEGTALDLLLDQLPLVQQRAVRLVRARHGASPSTVSRTPSEGAREFLSIHYAASASTPATLRSWVTGTNNGKMPNQCRAKIGHRFASNVGGRFR